MADKAKLSMVKNINSRIIYRYLRYHRNSTIPEISKATGLSLPTVTRTIDHAVSISLVEPTDITGGEKGRKAVCYSFSDSYCCFLHIVLKYYRVIVHVVSLTGKLLESLDTDIKHNEVAEKEIDVIIADMIKKHSNIRVVCITASGHIKNGIVYSSHTFPNLNGCNIKEKIEKKYNVAAFVENNIKILSYCGEKYVSDFQSKTVLYFSFEDEDGYGSAVSVDGVPLTGSSGAVGELYYFPIERRLISKQQTIVKFIQSMIAAFNPDAIVLYSDNSIDVKKIAPKVSEHFPKYINPEITFGNNMIEDNFYAMNGICLKHMISLV